MMNANEHCKREQHEDGLNLMLKADTVIRLIDGDASSSLPSGKDESLSGKSFSDDKSSFSEKSFTSLPSKHNFQATEVEKQEYRKAANRKSAFESRVRRKKLIEDLQDAIFDLHNEKAAMKQETDGMKLQLDVAMAENRQLRFNNMLMQQRLQQLGFAVEPTMFQPARIPDSSLAAFLPYIPLPPGGWSSNAQQLLQMQLFPGLLKGLQAQLQGSNKTKDDVTPLVLAVINGEAGHANQEETDKPPSSPPS
jgi:hypothetical protein